MSKYMQKHIWHYNLHKKFGEVLSYCVIKFAPTYDNAPIFKSLKAFLKRKKIRSYCIYEVFGHYDLFLRVWLPSFIRPENFKDELITCLSSVGCANAFHFIVDDNVLHWKWSKEPKQSDINAAATSEFLIELIDQNKEDIFERKEIKELEEQLVFRRYNPSEGIKFFIVIPPVFESFQFYENKIKVIDELKKLLLKTEKSKKIIEPSLYTGIGFASVLIKGKVPYDNYEALSILMKETNKFCGLSLIRSRTNTYLVTGSQKNSCIEAEGIAIETAPKFSKEKDISHYLQREEDKSFEIKGTLQFDVNKYVRENLKKENCRNNFSLAEEGVLKSIVGLLNADGGEIIIARIIHKTSAGPQQSIKIQYITLILTKNQIT